MKKLLVTGFGPFGEHGCNPSWEAVRRLPDVIGEYALHKMNLPTVYGKAADAVIQSSVNIGADAVLCVGLAAGRDAVTPERIAVNIRDARMTDNEGKLYSGQRIDPDGAAAYFVTVPVEEMARAIREQGIPAAVSNTAGTYVCNDVLYSLLRFFHGSTTRVGFIHVPNIPEQGSPGLPLEQTVNALTAAITALEI